jgi:YfiH family protein
MLDPNVGLYQRTKIFQPFKDVVAAQSTRNGGISPKPYQSLNLGLFTNDNRTNVAENRRRFFSSLQIREEQVVSSYQVHGDQVKVVKAPGQLEGFDALITNKRGLYLTVTIADCVPVLVYDPAQQVVAAVHAGWRGTAAQIIAATLKTMEGRYGTAAKDCLAFIGTCIDECSYEVGEEVAECFSYQQKRWDENRHKFFVDLKKANQDQLLTWGVPPENIEISPFSTVLNNDSFFSHRHEKGTTGRMLAVIGMKNIE